jgi:hypothetical protein
VRKVIAGVLLFVASLAGGVYFYAEHQIDNVLKERYPREALCRGDRWTARAQLRPHERVTIHVQDGQDITQPLFQFNACVALASERLQAEAAAGFDGAALGASDAARATFEARLPAYLDDRYSAGKAIATSAEDTVRTAGKFFGALFDKGFKVAVDEAKKESGQTQARAEAARLNALFNPPVYAFNAAIEPYFGEAGGYQAWLQQHPAALMAGVLDRPVMNVQAAPTAGAWSPVERGAPVALDAPALHFLASQSIAFSGEFLTQAAIARISGSARLMSIAKVGGALVIAPALAVKIDQAFNRRKVEQQRRGELDCWLKTSVTDASSAHANSTRDYTWTVRKCLIKAAREGRLIVALAPAAPTTASIVRTTRAN